MPDTTKAARAKFRALLNRPKCTVMPGGIGPLYARMAQEAGFECYFLPGSQLSTVLYGVPDNGIVGLRDLVDHARHMAALCDIPIQVDADTGYGNALNVYWATKEIVRSGVAALNIEDQEAPKKSGTVAGRRCIPLDEAVGKIRAAVKARDEIDPDFAICARCNSLGAEGETFEDALRRSVAYVKDGGADFVWLNSVETREQVRRAVDSIGAPLLAIWGGKEAAPTPEEYTKLGARIVLYPTFTSTYAVQAVWHLLNEIRERGPAALSEASAVLRNGKWGVIDAKNLVGADRIPALEAEFLPQSAQRDYEKTWGHRVTFEREGDEKK